MKEKILFNELKVGDIIGFSYINWWKYPIAFLIRLTCFILRKRKNGLDQQHVGQVIDVFRDEEKVVFRFAEQTGHEGKHDNFYVINKIGNNYFMDSRFKKINYHLMSLNYTLNEEERIKLIEYWLRPEKYVPIDAITSTRIFKEIREELKPNESIYDKDNFCSGACHAALYYIGIHNNIKQVDPVQLSRQPYLTVRF